MTAQCQHVTRCWVSVQLRHSTATIKGMHAGLQEWVLDFWDESPTR